MLDSVCHSLSHLSHSQCFPPIYLTPTFTHLMTHCVCVLHFAKCHPLSPRSSTPPPPDASPPMLLIVSTRSTLNPTLINRVGNDRGTQYRHGIYPHTTEQATLTLTLTLTQP